MAARPIFIPIYSGPHFVREVLVDFEWHRGMAASQRKKNVSSLHFAAEELGLGPVLEVSSASEMEVGRRLSAFNLKIEVGDREVSFESAYQGSKVFSEGGPYTDLYEVDSWTAKKDGRLRTSGRIVGFCFMGQEFPSDPPTAFYDWMYICALYPHADWLVRLRECAGFSDIAFNPERSLNCQARALAIFMSLLHRNLLGPAAESFESYLQIAKPTEATVGKLLAEW